MGGPETVFGEELRRLRSVAGLSLSALTTRIHYSKSHVSKVENGHASANRKFAEACDRALGTGGVLAALLAAQPPPHKGFSGLPTATRHFVGRADVLAQVRAVLLGPSGGTSVCVLTGMAGAGKTAVALRAAWDVETAFPDGCLFFDLHGHTPDSTEIGSDEAMDRILRVLGVPDVPADPDGRANIYRDRLRGRRMLLVFDNVRTARQVGPLLPVEPRSRVLITSRNRLNALDDAAHVPVEELSTAESVALFRAVAGDRVPDHEEAVLDVVRHCGRLPLALRIAAARFRSSPMWTLDELAGRLADHAACLTTLDDGERSVAAAFTLSCQELPTDQLRLFALLTLHPGHDIGLRAAAVLGGLSLAEAETLLIRLDDAHLVSLRSGRRVRLHDLVRGFAINHALPALPLDDRAAAADRLLDHMVSQAAAGDAVLSPRRYRPAFSLADPAPGIVAFTDQDAAMAWLDRELPTLVALVAMAAAHGTGAAGNLPSSCATTSSAPNSGTRGSRRTATPLPAPAPTTTAWRWH